MCVVSQRCNSEASFQTYFFPSLCQSNAGQRKFIKHFNQNWFSINLQCCKMHSKTCAVFKHVQLWRFDAALHLSCTQKPAVSSKTSRQEKPARSNWFTLGSYYTFSRHCRGKKKEKRHLAACVSSFRITAPPTDRVAGALIPEQTHYFRQCRSELNYHYKY